jgi:LacI family transcriptional regulator
MDQPPPKARVTDVARLAGVHASSVSRALNPATRHQISAPVVARILAAAETLGYQPDAIAASLRSGRSKMVGVVLPDMTNPVFPPILGGIEAVLDREAYVVIVANAAGDPARQRLVVERLLARQVDGLILATVARQDKLVKLVMDRGIPLVLVNRRERDGKVPAVTSNDALGMALAVKHLAGLGHRRLAHIGGPLALSTGHDRRQGFLAAIAAHGLDTPALIAAAAYSRDAGRKAASRLLAAHPDITGIVAANDLLAVGCLDALRQHGLACPGAVSLVGHNDMPLMDALSPALTTVRIRHSEMGQEAARLILRTLAGEKGDLQVVLQPELIVRSSTCPPP